MTATDPEPLTLLDIMRRTYKHWQISQTPGGAWCADRLAEATPQTIAAGVPQHLEAASLTELGAALSRWTCTLGRIATAVIPAVVIPTPARQPQHPRLLPVPIPGDGRQAATPP